MVKIARCIAPPIVHLAPEIAAALCLVATNPTSFMHELVPLMADDIHGKQAVGLLEGIVEGLVEACKSGPLPVDSFVFIFPVFVLSCPAKDFSVPILRSFLWCPKFFCPGFYAWQVLEQILLSMKKTSLHDNILHIISLHMDPMLPLPRLRMLSVSFLFIKLTFFFSCHVAGETPFCW